MYRRSLVLIGLFFALRPDNVPSGPRERDVEASVEGGAMEPSEVGVGEGDEVTLRFASEETVELHVHGYDLEEEAPRPRGGWPGVRKTGRASPGRGRPRPPLLFGKRVQRNRGGGDSRS